MKIALITDQHFGLKSNSDQVLDNFELFYKNIFFPYLSKNKIYNVIHLGDVFHVRKSIDTNVIKRSKEMFFDKLRNMNAKMYIIVGNHDIYLRDSNDINSPQEILSSYNNINVLTNPFKYVVNEKISILLVPWINKENANIVYETIKKSNSEICMGHFEFKGFKFNKTTTSEHGMGTKLFEKFDAVYSGHFHTKSSKGNIHYLGSPTQHTWMDVNEDKGFHVLDTETMQIEFIKNPYNLYEIVGYSDNFNDFESLKNKYVRVNPNGVESKTDLESFISNIEKYAYEVNVIENSYNNDLSFTVDTDSEEITSEDTTSIMKNYILGITDDIRHENVYNILVDAHNEVITA